MAGRLIYLTSAARALARTAKLSQFGGAGSATVTVFRNIHEGRGDGRSPDDSANDNIHMSDCSNMNMNGDGKIKRPPFSKTSARQFHALRRVNLRRSGSAASLATTAGNGNGGSSKPHDDHVEQLKQIPEEVLQRTAELERLISELSKTVEQHKHQMEKDHEARRFWKPESIESLHDKVLMVDKAVQATTNTINHLSGRDVVSERMVVAVATLFIIFILYKDQLYEWLGREAAEVASHSISDERTVESIRNTIILVAESPEAVQSVTALVKSVLAQEETRVALSHLMARVLATEWMQEVGVYYFMSILNDKEVIQWMNDQAARVVQDTMADPGVQQSTGEGAWRAFVYGFTPKLGLGYGSSTGSGESKTSTTGSQDKSGTQSSPPNPDSSLLTDETSDDGTLESDAVEPEPSPSESFA